MIYEYLCKPCGKLCEIIKRVADLNRQENCEECGTIMERQVSGGQHLLNTAVQERYYSHALGQVVKGPQDERRIAKAKGMIEVGNERPRKHLKVETSSYDI